MTSSPAWHIGSELGGRPRIRGLSIMPRRGPSLRSWTPVPASITAAGRTRPRAGRPSAGRR